MNTINIINTHLLPDFYEEKNNLDDTNSLSSYLRKKEIQNSQYDLVEGMNIDEISTVVSNRIAKALDKQLEKSLQIAQ